MTDVVGSVDMLQGANTSFTSDRFGNPNSALALNGGWAYVPTGFYFNSLQLSISLWVYPQSVNSLSRVVDFGSNTGIDNIVLTLDSGINDQLRPKFFIFFGGTSFYTPSSSQALILNQWQFLVATFDGSMMKVYIDGITVASATITSFSLATVSRPNNYIGQSNWFASGDGYSSSYFDDLRFYSISLNQWQINALMVSNDTNCYCTTTTSTNSTTSKLKYLFFVNIKITHFRQNF